MESLRKTAFKNPRLIWNPHVKLQGAPRGRSGKVIVQTEKAKLRAFEEKTGGQHCEDSTRDTHRREEGIGRVHPIGHAVTKGLDFFPYML